MDKENKKQIKGDVLLIAAILLIAAAGLLYNYIQQHKTPPAAENMPITGNSQSSAAPDIIINNNESRPQSGMSSYVEISIDGRIIEKLDLSQDTEIIVEGYQNGTNHLIIENGEAWIEDASCPDKVCIHQGKISKNSEMIVCLPNLMIAQIRIAEPAGPPESAAE